MISADGVGAGNTPWRAVQRAVVSNTEGVVPVESEHEHPNTMIP
jgi:hypothetical protein